MSWQPRGNEQGVEFEVEVMATTEKAMLLKFEDLDRQYWIPKSQISDEGEIHTTTAIFNSGAVILSPWIAEQKGLRP